MQSEEERLGVDFGDLWRERQMSSVVKSVEQAEQPNENVKELTVDNSFATGCAWGV